MYSSRAGHILSFLSNISCFPVSGPPTSVSRGFPLFQVCLCWENTLSQYTSPLPPLPSVPVPPLFSCAPAPTPQRCRRGWATPRPRCSCSGQARSPGWSWGTCSTCPLRCPEYLRGSPLGSPASAPRSQACPVWKPGAIGRWRFRAATSAGPRQRPGQTGRWSGTSPWSSPLPWHPPACRGNVSRYPRGCLPG